MAKKDKKKSDKKDKGGAADAVRAAVEQAFAATAGGAASTRGRAQELVDDITAMAARVRESLEELNVIEDLRGLRTEVDALAKRVAALEASAAEAKKPAPRRAAARSSVGTKAAGTKAAGTRAPARRSTRPKPKPEEPADSAAPGRS
ncbi:MAG TPA: hypothetical protein VF533_09635 [Solirubrobacteraceae bacterium]